MEIKKVKYAELQIPDQFNALTEEEEVYAKMRDPWDKWIEEATKEEEREGYKTKDESIKEEIRKSSWTTEVPGSEKVYGIDSIPASLNENAIPTPPTIKFRKHPTLLEIQREQAEARRQNDILKKVTGKAEALLRLKEIIEYLRDNALLDQETKDWILSIVCIGTYKPWHFPPFVQTDPQKTETTQEYKCTYWGRDPVFCDGKVGQGDQVCGLFEEGKKCQR